MRRHRISDNSSHLSFYLAFINGEECLADHEAHLGDRYTGREAPMHDAIASIHIDHLNPTLARKSHMSATRMW
jgi:hypothetical protein